MSAADRVAVIRAPRGAATPGRWIVEPQEASYAPKVWECVTRKWSLIQTKYRLEYETAPDLRKRRSGAASISWR